VTPQTTLKKNITDYLQDQEKDKVIDRSFYHRIYPGEDIPCIYGLPKIHMEGVPLRPIMSSINSVTHNIAEHLASILATPVGNTLHHIQNHRLVKKIQHLKLSPSETIVSFDVTSLFTCIPIISSSGDCHEMAVAR